MPSEKEDEIKIKEIRKGHEEKSKEEMENNIDLEMPNSTTIMFMFK